MADKPFRLGPVALTTTTTTNILNPPVQAAAGVGVGAQNVGVRLRHLRVVNKTAGSATFSLWLGATGANAAGTEVVGIGKSVAANDAYDWYGDMLLSPTDFLVGGASANTTLTIQGEGVLFVI